MGNILINTKMLLFKAWEEIMMTISYKKKSDDVIYKDITKIIVEIPDLIYNLIMLFAQGMSLNMITRYVGVKRYNKNEMKNNRRWRVKYYKQQFVPVDKIQVSEVDKWVMDDLTKIYEHDNNARSVENDILTDQTSNDDEVYTTMFTEESGGTLTIKVNKKDDSTTIPEISKYDHDIIQLNTNKNVKGKVEIGAMLSIRVSKITNNSKLSEKILSSLQIEQAREKLMQLNINEIVVTVRHVANSIKNHKMIKVSGMIYSNVPLKLNKTTEIVNGDSVILAVMKVNKEQLAIISRIDKIIQQDNIIKAILFEVVNDTNIVYSGSACFVYEHTSLLDGKDKAMNNTIYLIDALIKNSSKWVAVAVPMANDVINQLIIK